MYVKIPLLLRVDLVSRPGNIVFLGAGPQLSVLLAEDGVIPVYAGPEKGVAGDSLVIYDYAEAAGAYNHFTMDVAGSMGWRARLYKKLFFLVQFRVECSLTDIENKSYSVISNNSLLEEVYYLYSKERPATHSIAYGAGIGLSYKFR